MTPTAASISADKTLHILHFNDVYNIESAAQEPVGGAARFCTAMKSLSAHLEPLVLFSGDVFAPSFSKAVCKLFIVFLSLISAIVLFCENTVSTFTKGEQMVPVLNALGIHCSVFGNHDFGI